MLMEISTQSFLSSLFCQHSKYFSKFPLHFKFIPAIFSWNEYLDAFSITLFRVHYLSICLLMINFHDCSLPYIRVWNLWHLKQTLNTFCEMGAGLSLINLYHPFSIFKLQCLKLIFSDWSYCSVDSQQTNYFWSD